MKVLTNFLNDILLVYYIIVIFSISNIKLRLLLEDFFTCFRNNQDFCIIFKLAYIYKIFYFKILK